MLVGGRDLLMPVVVTTTGSSANAYASRAAAIATAEANPRPIDAAFLALTGPEQDRALIYTARELDSLCLLDAAHHLGGGTVHAAFVSANIEAAIWATPAFAAGAAYDVLTVDTRAIEEVKAGPVTIKWAGGGTATASSVLAPFPPLVQRLLENFVCSARTNAWGAASVFRSS